MLIRRPVAEVPEAIVNPEIGRPVRWDWEMYDVSINVTPKAIEPNRRILVEWPGYIGPTG